ncbi:MAG: hypothetical protein R2695_04155 [Acidimicrobiales bacterium]
MAKKTLKIEVLGDARDGQRALSNLGVQVEETGGRFDGFADKAAAGLVAGAALDKLVEFGSAMNTAGLQAEISGKKAATVFGPALADMQKWADGLNESLGVTDTQLLGMASGMADLLKPMGFSAQQAAGMTQDMLDLSGALSAWSGGERSAAEVSDILASAMLGERDSLKSLGISINQAEVDARALAIARRGPRRDHPDGPGARHPAAHPREVDRRPEGLGRRVDGRRQEPERAVSHRRRAQGRTRAGAVPGVRRRDRVPRQDFIPALGQVGGFISDNKEAFIAPASPSPPCSCPPSSPGPDPPALQQRPPWPPRRPSSRSAPPSPA